MKQIPGPKSETIRVVLDQAEMHKMLDPILKEVNSLRARVTELEGHMEVILRFAELTAECQKENNNVLTVLVSDLTMRGDDGK